LIQNINYDLKLIGRNITRLEDIINSYTPINHNCNVCRYTWKAAPNSVTSSKTGCPKCSGKLPITNEIYDIRLIGRNISRLEDIINANTPINHQCMMCNHIWRTRPSDIMGKHKSGCPQCSGKLPITNESYDIQLLNRDITRLEDVKNNYTPIKHQCNICSHIWKAKTNDVTSIHKTGCAKCSGKLPITNEIYDIRLIGRNITRVEHVKNNHTPINHNCNICNHIWKAAPNSVTSSKTGCPKCSKLISKPEIEWLDSLNIPNDPEHRQVVLKIGKNKFKADGYDSITNTVYEFNGDFWHGNPKIFNPNDINPRTYKTYGTLYEETLQRRQLILDAGYHLVEIWESDWILKQKDRL